MKVTRYSVCFLAALALILAAAGCSGKHSAAGLSDTGSTAGQPALSGAITTLAGMGSLASPLEMLKNVSTGPSDNDRHLDGAKYGSALPHNRVSSSPSKSKEKSASVTGSSLKFSPAWTGDPGEALSDAAYATFAFSNMDIYSGSARLLLDWETLPANLGGVYLGVSNFGSNTWEWHQPAAGTTVMLPDFGPYTSGTGQILAVVLVLGNDTPLLNWILAGDSLNPYVYLNTDLNSDPTQNFAPLTVNFNTIGSFDVGSTMASYDWDFNSDGTYEIEDDAVGQQSHLFANPGEYTVTVHGVTADGKASTANKTFIAIDPANTAPNAVLILDKLSGAAPLAIHFSGASSTDDGQIVDYQWDLDNDMIYETDTGAVPSLDHVFGEKGSHPVHMKITDNDLATAVATVPFNVTNGWSHTVIAGGINAADPIAGTVTGLPGARRACIAYADYTNNDIFFARATAEDGSTWGPPLAPIDNNADTGYGLVMAENSLSGAPMIAYGNYENTNKYTLHFVKATSASGSNWNNPIDIALNRDIGGVTDMKLIGGVPAIVSLDNFSGGAAQEMRFYLAKDATGNTWNTSAKVANALSGLRITDLSLGVFNGLPYVCTIRDDGNIFSDYMYQATLADGSHWGGEIALGDASGYGIDTTVVDGNPAVAWGSSSQGGSTGYLRANDGPGTDWPADSYMVAPSEFGGAPSLAIIGESPAVAYYSLDEAKIMYSIAGDQQGAIWSKPYEVLDGAAEGTGCVLLNVNDHPVILLVDDDTNSATAVWFAP